MKNEWTLFSPLTSRWGSLVGWGLLGFLGRQGAVHLLLNRTSLKKTSTSRVNNKRSPVGWSDIYWHELLKVCQQRRKTVVVQYFYFFTFWFVCFIMSHYEKWKHDFCKCKGLQGFWTIPAWKRFYILEVGGFLCCHLFLELLPGFQQCLNQDSDLFSP